MHVEIPAWIENKRGIGDEAQVFQLSERLVQSKKQSLR